MLPLDDAFCHYDISDAFSLPIARFFAIRRLMLRRAATPPLMPTPRHDAACYMPPCRRLRCRPMMPRHTLRADAARCFSPRHLIMLRAAASYADAA